MNPALMPILLVAGGAVVAGLFVYMMNQPKESTASTTSSLAPRPSTLLFPDRPAASVAFQTAIDATELAARKAASETALRVFAPHLSPPSEPAVAPDKS